MQCALEFWCRKRDGHALSLPRPISWRKSHLENPIKKAFLVAFLCVGFSAPGANGQVVVREVDGRPSCMGCRITLGEYARLSSPDDGPDIDNESVIAMDSSGRFLVTAQ